MARLRECNIYWVAQVKQDVIERDNAAQDQAPRERLIRFKGFYIEIRYKVVGKNIFSLLFVLYALKDRKIKLSLRIL